MCERGALKLIVDSMQNFNQLLFFCFLTISHHNFTPFHTHICFIRNQKARAWKKAVDFLSSTDSRIRVETQRISGEDFEVWRWIGVVTTDKKVRGASNHLVSVLRKGTVMLYCRHQTRNDRYLHERDSLMY